jgi:hypothetical protein
MRCASGLRFKVMGAGPPSLGCTAWRWRVLEGTEAGGQKFGCGLRVATLRKVTVLAGDCFESGRSMVGARKRLGVKIRIVCLVRQGPSWLRGHRATIVWSKVRVGWGLGMMAEPEPQPKSAAPDL